MSKATSKPISRREQDQMKRNKLNDNKSASDNKGVIEKCKNLLKRKNSEN